MVFQFLSGFFTWPMMVRATNDAGSEDKDKSDKREEVEEEPELVDPRDTIKDRCNQLEEIANKLNIYEKCNDRVNSRVKTAETCEEELFDYVTVLDHCISKTLWSKLR